MSGGAEIEELLRRTDPQLVYLLLDLGHAYREHTDLVAFFTKHHARIDAMHLRDIRGTEQVPLGQGELDFPGLASLIRQTGWSGWLTDEEENLHKGKDLSHGGIDPAIRPRCHPQDIRGLKHQRRHQRRIPSRATNQTWIRAMSWVGTSIHWTARRLLDRSRGNTPEPSPKTRSRPSRGAGILQGFPPPPAGGGRRLGLFRWLRPFASSRACHRLMSSRPSGTKRSDNERDRQVNTYALPGCVRWWMIPGVSLAWTPGCFLGTLREAPPSTRPRGRS